MFVSPRIRYAVCTGSALVLLAVCWPAAAGAARLPSVSLRHTGSCRSGPAAFVSDFNNSAVYEIDSAGRLCATLTGFTNPQGLATDKTGNLFVANTDAGDIVELGPPYTGSAVATYMDPGEFPVDVAIDGNGNLAATNLGSAAGGAGNVAFFNAGSTGGPTRTVSAPTYTSPRFCAFDRHGNLAFDDEDIFNTGAFNLGAILHNGTSIIPLTTSNTLTSAGGVQVNSAGQLAVLVGSAIDTYKAPIGRNLGSPIYTTSLSGGGLTFAFTPGSSRVLAVGSGVPGLSLYDYPAGGSPIASVSLPNGSLPIGIAIVPTEQFTVR